MRVYPLSLMMALFFAMPLMPAMASHLSEKEVANLEQQCDADREEKLAPERAAVLRQCLAEGQLDGDACVDKASQYGEPSMGAIRTLGRYYDLPSCVEAFEARSHFQLNPGR